MVTFTEEIVALLKRVKHPMTAMEISARLEIKTSTASSILYRLFRSGKIGRQQNFGPRGGTGYVA